VDFLRVGAAPLQALKTYRRWAGGLTINRPGRSFWEKLGSGAESSAAWECRAGVGCSLLRGGCDSTSSGLGAGWVLLLCWLQRAWSQAEVVDQRRFALAW